MDPRSFTILHADGRRWTTSEPRSLEAACGLAEISGANGLRENHPDGTVTRYLRRFPGQWYPLNEEA